jgi:riboflavin kinase / FMN adenylyltransferase
MEVRYIKDFKHIDSNIKNLSLVLGYFDGLHIGHTHLINYAKMNSIGPVGVVTFDKPLKSIEGQITTLDEKIALIEKLKIDYVFVLVADDKFKHMSYIDFINKVLKRFNPKVIFCGNDYTFGYEAKGNVYDLKMAFANVQVVNYVNDFNRKKISSSSIKNLIKEGLVKEASVFLGRPYSLSGTVSHGFQEGTKLGRPTANLESVGNLVIPKDGVYITRTKVDKTIYDSITNIGTHPTINKVEKPIIETYVMGFNKNLYGKEITIYFYKRLRDEIKFDSVSDLEDQITKDIENASEYLKNNL